MKITSKSKSYPAVSLAAALRIIEEARPLGKTIAKGTLGSVGRSDAKGSTKSGAFIRKLSALGQYGLVQVEAGNLTFTDMADAIIYPKNDGERKQNIVKAFLSPVTFYELFSNLSKNLPINVNLLKSKAIREIGITEKGVGQFLNSFVLSGHFAGLISYLAEDKQTIKLLEEASADTAEIEKAELEVAEDKIEAKPHEKDNTLLLKSTKDEQTAAIFLSHGIANISVPSIFTEKDKQRLVAQLEVFLVQENSQDD